MPSGDSRTKVWERVGVERGVVERLDVESSPVLAKGSVKFRRLTALTGVHGAGKSYLLTAVAEGLPGWQAKTNLPIETSGNEAQFSGDYSLALRAGSPTDLVGFSRPIHWKSRPDYDASLQPLVATWLTPFAALSDLSYFSQNWMPTRPSEPLEVADLKRSQVDALQAITGHTYESVAYGRFEEDDQCFPYFRVVRNSQQAEVWTMSASEFWVHYVIWHLRSADENEVVLIDEPETFLAQPGHRAFVDEIARLALETRCQVILATHSEEMIRRLPPVVVRQVSSTANGAVVSEVASTEALLRTLGRSRAPLALLVFVEDDMARKIVHFFLACYAPDRVAQVDVIDSGGKDEVMRGVKISGRSRRLRTVGVLDGDQRDLYADERLLFLPGVMAPEVLLLEVLRSRDQDAAARLGAATPDLLIAIDAARFVPHQRVFEVMSEALASTKADDLIRVALSMWLEDDSTAAAGRQLVEQMLASVAHNH
jgi:predicted ATPase